MKKKEMPVVAIIGGGFCGLMTAINLIEKATHLFHHPGFAKENLCSR